MPRTWAGASTTRSPRRVWRRPRCASRSTGAGASPITRRSPSTMTTRSERDWRSRLPQGIRPYFEPAPLAALFLGISSGFAFSMIGATLTTRLAQHGITKSAVTAFALTFLAYNFKFLWAPIVDNVRLPLVGRFGQRRSWLWLVGVLVMAAVALLGIANPAEAVVAYFSPLVEFMRREGALIVLLFVLIHKIGDTLANLTLRLLFADLGFTNDEIAFYDVGVGFIALLIGIFIGGILYARLGMKRSVFISLILMAVSNFSFSALSAF